MNAMNRRELPGTNPLARYAMADAADIEEGDIVCLNTDGEAVEGSDTAGLTVAGIAVHVDADAGVVEVRDGVIELDIADSDGPTRADRGKPVYVTGPTEVATASSNKIPAGTLVDVYEDMAWVDVRPVNAAAASAGATAGTAAGAIAGAAAIAADLADGASTIKAAATTIAGDTVAAAGNVRLVASAPATAGAAGVKGDIFVDGTDIYVCTATDTWIKGTLALATW